ncbi:MAG: MFS transporter [Oscillospiraceae bacterium]|nr:MFS transporter [Oscillospiraceae bacterium]
MDKKKLSVLFIICMANSLIYTLPYIQSTYYDSMQAAYGFTHVQMGNLVSAYGIFNIFSNFFGGVAADAFDTKKLFVFSMIATGVSGLYSATLPSYPVMLAINVFWSVSTTLTFWSAMIKAVKNLADDAHQGQVFGFKETICCIITFVFSMAALAVFRLTGENFVILLVLYSVMHILIGVLVAIFMPSLPPEGKPQLYGLVKGIGAVIRLKGVWLIGMTIFFTQFAAIIFGRFTPFLTGIGGLSASTVAFITIVAANGFANIGSLSGGKISDAMGSPSKFIACVLGVTALITVAFLFIPWGSETVWLCVLVAVVFRILNGALRSVQFATMSQVNIPPQLIGTASGIISIIGYLPDIFGYTLCGMAMEKFRPIIAYKIIFTGLVVCCLVGMMISLTLHRYSKHSRNTVAGI